jgi:hypothetical protein
MSGSGIDLQGIVRTEKGGRAASDSGNGGGSIDPIVALRTGEGGAAAG